VIYQFFKKYPLYVITTLLFMFLVPINDVYLSKLYGNMFQSVQNDTFQVSYFLTILFVIFFLQMGYAVRDLLDSKQIPFFQQHCKELFLKRIFDNYNRDQTLSSDVVSKIIRTQHIITAWYSKLATFIIPHVFELVFTTVYLFTIDRQIGIAFMMLLLVLIVVIFISPLQSEKYTKQSDKKLSQIYELLDDVLANFFSVYKEDKLQAEIDLINKTNDDFISSYMKSVYNALLYRFGLIVGMLLFLYFFVSRINTLMQAKVIEKATFFSLIMMTTHLFSNIMWIIDVIRDIIFDYGTIKNAEFLKPDTIKQEERKELCISKVKQDDIIIEVNQLYFKYKEQKKWILEDINLAFRKGEKVLVTGEIGSGKSTLLKLFLRMLKPSKGFIYIRGQCYDSFSEKSFYKQVACIPQNCVLFNRSIIDNIRYDNPRISKADVIKIIDQFGINKHFDNLKQGLDSSAGKHGNNLSGGQRQLVWFLKVFLKDPDVIFMDEPTASLDKATKELFWSVMDHFFKEKTIVIVTHDDYLLSKQLKIIKLKHGKVAEKIS
jgi:ABC-type multidrug transport system fused ATPase/permease subunit